MLSFTDEMHKNTDYKYLNYDRVKTGEYFQKLIDLNQFIHLTDGCLMIGSLEKVFFGDSLIASDILIYVKKEHRGLGLSIAAVNEFIKWSENAGASRISIGRSSGVNEKEFKSLAVKCGFNKLGEVYAR